MIWEAFSPVTFDAVFKQRLRDWLELSYLAAVPGSFVFFGFAVHRLLRSPRAWLRCGLELLMAASWCLALLVGSVLMAVRTGL